MNESLYEIDYSNFDIEIFRKFENKRKLKVFIYKSKPLSYPEKQISMVLFHGGGFRIGSPDRFYPQALYFSSLGYKVFVPEYRTEEKYGTTAMHATEDAHFFYNWLISNSKRLKINKNKIIIGGGSAGGQLAASIANVKYFRKENLPKPLALILYNPALNISRKTKVEDNYFRLYYKDPGKQPLDNFPPCIIMHGTKDNVIPIKWISEFVDNLKSKGIDCVFKTFEGEEHGFFNKNLNNYNFLATNKLIKNFLKKRGI